MEKKLIEEWLKVEVEVGSGYGYGSGYGSGDGSGYGDGDGSGDGYGYGYGDGYGYGYGDGSGSGYGDGYGDGYGIKKYNEHYIFEIDNVNTIITNIKGNIAKGFIVNRDLTLIKTFVIKGSNLFAHGNTIKEAMQSLQKKIFSDLDIDEKIEEFKKQFNKKDKYKGHLYFKWHNLLTGSCLQGRNNFVENSGYSLDDEFTVEEFLNIVRNAYGWNVLKELEKYYK